ncbi:glycosyltransferase [uncultured Litoreibacter sp.]|uniref:glycosyltransferase family 2 protein n=1 Tax=uncultured Litoreibacter sp. TaxID=1392394 RepID=UPI002604F488|nr:glycosyltransferase [uncultured Litoreibacter sp.]
MMPPLVSVVIVSRNRPKELRNCIRALDFQTHRKFELIVVTDEITAAKLPDLIPIERVKSAVCAEANISKARNQGVALAAGEIVAFIDDDAIAEPTWLNRLTAPFRDPNIGASGGFVRGRNGISFQWRAEEVGLDGTSHAIAVDQTTVFAADPKRAIKTQGTNCAFRIDALRALGGFDESYKFYLDETDLNIRINQAGYSTAIVPLAEVQHGYAASSMRGRDRRPKSLFEIGASHAYFIKKYDRPQSELDSVRAEQWARLDAALARGLIKAEDVEFLRSDLEAGIAEGSLRDHGRNSAAQKQSKFLQYLDTSGVAEHQFVTGRWISRRKVYAQAKEIAKAGTPCTAIILSPTTLFHHRWFHSDGFWVQTGGIFGKSTRSDPIWTWYRCATRVKVEQADLSRTR